MTSFEIAQVEDTWVLFEDDEPVLAPDGTPLWSRARGLMDDVLADARLFGTDPGAYPSLVCLQLSYLAFAVPDTVEGMAGSILTVVAQLAEARFPGAVDEGRYLFLIEAARHQLLSMSKRELMTVTVAWRHLGSPTHALRLLGEADWTHGVWTPDDDPVPVHALARGLCDRCCAWTGQTVGGAAREAGLGKNTSWWDDGDWRAWSGLFPDAWSVPAPPPEQRFPGLDPRFEPQLMDDAFCREQCCALPLAASADDFHERCAMARVLYRMRRFGETPEE